MSTASMAGFLPITSLFAGLHILVFTLLSFVTAAGRGQVMSQNKDPEKDVVFKRKSAAQTNFYQYMPAILLAMALLEGNEVLAPSYLYVLGVVITAARLCHCTQLFFGPETVPMPFRMAGALTTFAFMGLTSLLLILLGLQEAGLLPDNFLGNHRTWLGFAKDNYGTASDNAQSGYNTASAKAKAGYQKAKATIKDKAAEF